VSARPRLSDRLDATLRGRQAFLPAAPAGEDGEHTTPESETVDGQPPHPGHQPSTGHGQPSGRTVNGHPSTGHGHPSTGHGHPSTGDGPSSSLNGGPSNANGGPSTVEGPPPTGDPRAGPVGEPESSAWEARHKRVTFYCPTDLLQRVEVEMRRSGRSKTAVIVDALSADLAARAAP
jgi:hypothetical protein